VQLATSDVSALSTELVSFFEGIVRPSTEVVLLSTKLAGMMGTAQLLQCYAYLGLAGYWTRVVGPSIASLATEVQQAEGALAATHARVHENAEQVTMLRGMAYEQRQLDGCLATLQRRASALSLQRLLSEALDGYVLRYLGVLNAFVSMLPAVYYGGAGSAAAEDPTEYFLTSLHLLVNVGMAFKDLVLSHKAFSASRALAGRVGGLFAAIDGVPALAAPPSQPAAAQSEVAVLELDGLSVSAPDGTPVVQGLSLRLLRGQRLLLRGPNGAGKTSLMRVLAGVWQPSGGTVVSMPPPEAVAFVPQRAYVPPHASLAQALWYPDEPAASSAADEKISELLRWAGMNHLPAAATPRAAGGCAGLSAGEQQRLCLARLRLREPRLAVLDESTANLEPAFEAEFFAWCASAGLSLITISHNLELRAHHSLELQLDGCGGSATRTLSGDDGLTEGGGSSSKSSCEAVLVDDEAAKTP